MRDLDALAELPRLGYPYAPSSRPAPPRWDPGTAPGHPLVLEVHLERGSWRAVCAARGERAVRSATPLAEALAGAAAELAEHCAGTAGSVVASDFPLAGVDDGALAALLTTLSDHTGGERR